MLVAKLDLNWKIIVVYGGGLCVCERGFVYSVFYYITFLFLFFLFLDRFRGHANTRHKDFKRKRKGKEEETWKVRDMLCHAYVSKPMNRKVYWDLSGECVKNSCILVRFVRVRNAPSVLHLWNSWKWQRNSVRTNLRPQGGCSWELLLKTES